jgi:hypothetical protein
MNELLYLLVRNDDGYPVVLEVFSNEDEAKTERDRRGRGYFVQDTALERNF